MKKALNNPPLLYTLLALAAYWTIGPFIPKPGVSNGVSILAICAGIFLFVQYAEAAWKILVHKDRDPDGAHWAIIGATAAAIGTVYSGAFTLLWNHFEAPQVWQSTTTSSFGRGLVPVGFFLMGISHETMRIGGSYPRGFWRAVFIMMALIISFIAGANFASWG